MHRLHSVRLLLAASKAFFEMATRNFCAGLRMLFGGRQLMLAYSAANSRRVSQTCVSTAVVLAVIPWLCPVALCLETQSSQVPGSETSSQTTAVSYPAVLGSDAFSGAAPDWFGYSSPVRVNLFAGDNYVEPDEFVTLDVFKPIRSWRFSRGSEQIEYVDARFGLNFEGSLLANFGIGRRHFFAGDNTIVDANIWYDVDGTGESTFHQLTAGGQIQNESVIFRGHYYFPIGDTEQSGGYTALTGNSAFRGNTVALERYRIEETAYRGFDAELGFTLPCGRDPVTWYVGYYNFTGQDAPDITGFSTTLAKQVMSSLNMALQFTYDDETDTGVMLTATYDFYHRAGERSRSIRHRLGESARRNRHILKRTSYVYDPLTATDAAGNDINVIHVSSSGTGAGTVESPFADLALAQTGAIATSDSIVFLHADSVLTGQSITLPAGTRLLGEGGAHTVVTSELGTITLPRATSGSAIPIIRNAPAAGPAVTLADNVEVNSIRIENAGAVGIFGSGLTGGTSIRNTSIDGATTGIHLLNNGGTHTLDTLTIANTTGNGLLFEGNLDGSDISVDGSLAINNAGNHGIFFDRNADTAAVTFNAPTTINTTGGDGVRVSNIDTTANGGINSIQFLGDLTVNNTTGSAFVMDSNDTNVAVNSLAATGWGQSAILINNTSGHFTMTNPLVLDNAAGSLASTIAITNSTAGVTFGDVTITDTSRAAAGAATVFLSENDTGLDEITFNSLNITANNGIALQATESGGNLGKLDILGGVISTTGSTAIDLTRIATDVTFTSVSASNTATGIRLQDLGTASAFHNQFRIAGDGATAGSGGVMTNVQRGVVVNGSEDVSLNFMSIDSTVAGVSVTANGFNQSENLAVNNLVLTDAAGTANWVGIDVSWGSGAHFSDPNVFSSNTITGSGTGQTGIRIVNVQSNPQMEATIGGNTITLTGAGSNGVSLSATGFGAPSASNLGGINLTTSVNNVINATASPFITSENNGATVNGQIRVNGVLVP